MRSLRGDWRRMARGVRKCKVRRSEVHGEVRRCMGCLSNYGSRPTPTHVKIHSVHAVHGACMLTLLSDEECRFQSEELLLGVSELCAVRGVELHRSIRLAVSEHVPDGVAIGMLWRPWIVRVLDALPLGT